MQPDIDVSFSSVSKRYFIRQQEQAASDGRARSRWKAKLGRGEPRREFWAVKDVSFSVEHGEALGIIGHNGAGKSTVLKMLSGITAPTQGEISIRGRLSALLEVGSGFHPELTGRENIYLSGSVLGMARQEISRKLDSIVEFAGIQRFIDMPVKRYSSGMFVRLGFSIAAHLEPDVLLLDEVLAVGDRAFREKCHERIGELHANGTTIVFISHDLASVQKLCQRVLLLERGSIAAEGNPQEVIHCYTETANLTHDSTDSKSIQITDIAFFDESGQRSAGFRTGWPIRAQVEYFATEQIREAAISVVFRWTEGWAAAHWTTLRNGSGFTIRPGKGSIEFSSEELALQPGVFKIDALVEETGTRRVLDSHYGCSSIYVKGGKQTRGIFYSPHRWREIEPGD